MHTRPSPTLYGPSSSVTKNNLTSLWKNRKRQFVHNFLFTIFVPLNPPPPTRKVMDFLPLEFLLTIFQCNVSGGGLKSDLQAKSWCQLHQELSGDPNPQYSLKSTAVQMGGVLQYKWEVYCWVSLSSRLLSQEGPAIQMGGVLPYKLEVYCRTFFETSRGWGFRNSSDYRPKV